MLSFSAGFVDLLEVQLTSCLRVSFHVESKLSVWEAALAGGSQDGLAGPRQCMVWLLGLACSTLPLAAVGPWRLSLELPTESGFRWPTFQLLLQDSLATCSTTP